MMFNNKFIACVKVGGKIMRESGDKVYLPFGSEFSIYLKNLDTARAKAKVFIDGAEVTEGVELVIGKNEPLELERYIKNGNMSSGNKFKFIERTESVEQHRGIGAEDGLVRIEYAFELVPAVLSTPGWITSKDWNLPYDPYKAYGTICSTADMFKGSDTIRSRSMSVADAGITVPGSVSDQQFHTTTNFMVTQWHSMVFQLVGQVDGSKVAKPVTVKTKPRCVTCGRQNKATAKFCATCGTSLTIV